MSIQDPLSPIRVGLVGFGLAGRAFHAPLIAGTQGMVLVAVVTANPKRQEEVHQKFPAAGVVASFDALMAMAGSLDLVVIASPNRTHVSFARTALEAGLAVVVDKPMAGSSVEALSLVALSKQRQLLLSVFQNRRWDNDFLTLRKLIAEGRLGKVHRFESRFERWRPQVADGWRDSSEPAEVGGVMYDLGSHLVDQALLLFGPVSQVYAEIDRSRPDAKIEDDVFLALTHANAVRSHLWMSSHAASSGPRFRVLGDKAAYVKEGLDPQEALLRAGDRPGAIADWGSEPEDRWGRLGAGEAHQLVRSEPGDYPAYYLGIAAALREKLPPPVDPSDSIDMLRILEAARRSATNGSPIAL